MSPILNRREAIAALASTATLPLLHACGDNPSPAAVTPEATQRRTPRRCSIRSARATCASRRKAPRRSASIPAPGPALRSQLADRSAEGQQKIAAQVRQDLEKVKAFDASGLSHATRTSIEVVRSAYQLAVRWLRASVRRHHRRQLAQYAVRGDPERRRLSRPSAFSRQRPSDRERRRCGCVSRPAAVVCEAARWRARTASRRRAAKGWCRRRS